MTTPITRDQIQTEFESHQDKVQTVYGSGRDGNAVAAALLTIASVLARGVDAINRASNNLEEGE